MTLGEVQQRLKQIHRERNDPEEAHILEDNLLQDVLVAIAQGHDDPKNLALVALQVRSIEFPRFYA